MRQAKLTAEQIEASAWAAALAPKMVEDKIPPGWFTTKQIAKKLGKPRSSVQRDVFAAVDAGRCEVKSFRVCVGAFARATRHYKLK